MAGPIGVGAGGAHKGECGGGGGVRAKGKGGSVHAGAKKCGEWGSGVGKADGLEGDGCIGMGLSVYRV